MVDIIGTDATIAKKVTCGCGCILQYYKPDVHTYAVMDFGGGRDRVYYIHCPSCIADITVSAWEA